MVEQKDSKWGVIVGKLSSGIRIYRCENYYEALQLKRECAYHALHAEIIPIVDYCDNDYPWENE
jgi:hypothetical protein